MLETAGNEDYKIIKTEGEEGEEKETKKIIKLQVEEKCWQQEKVLGTKQSYYLDQI